MLYSRKKIKIFVEENFSDEIKRFQKKKYLLKIELISDEKLIIPEYKIELLNKSKKLLNKFHYIKEIIVKPKIKNQKQEEKITKKNKKDVKKSKSKTKLRTLWVRRKKLNQTFRG